MRGGGLDLNEPNHHQKTRLVPRLIAVGAEWAANTPQLSATAAGAAFAAGAPGIGLLILGGYAAAIMAKNAAQNKTAAEAQAGVELYLTALVQQHKTIHKAIDAIHTEQHMHELVSRDRVEELWQLFQGSITTLEQRIEEHQELTFVIADYMEKWREKYDASLDYIESALAALPQIQNQIAVGFDEVKADGALTREQLANFENKFDAFTQSSAMGREEIGTSTPMQIGPDGVQALNKFFRAASATLLNWGTTVGKGGHRISCDVEQKILKSITEKKTSCNLVLGPKGAGKSALSAALASAAMAQGFAVLGIRADRIPAKVENQEQLRQHLEKLPVKAADALRLMAAKQPTLLIVDQLDSVSELLDRKSERLNLLLNLIRDVSNIENLHIVAACREFDFRHDARLSTIAANEIWLSPADWESVAPVLKAEGHDPEVMGNPLRELLRIPWNLDLFLRVAVPGRVFASMQSLIEAVWQKSVLNADGPAGRSGLVEKLALWMSDHEELFVPVSIADDFPAAKDALLSNDIITSEANGRALAFRHQTFYDYAIARLFASGTKSLADHVREHQEGLFVRPSLINGLELLRDSSKKEYYLQVRRVLADCPRFHIRTLVIEFIAQQANPDDAEVEFVLPLLRGDDGRRVLRAAADSPGWFSAFRASGDLAAWMRKPADEAAFCVGMLVSSLRHSQGQVLELVQDNWFHEQSYDRLIEVIANNLKAWTPQWLSLFSSVVGRSSVEVIWLSHRVVTSNPRVAVLLVRRQLERELAEAKRQEAEAEEDTSAIERPLYGKKNAFDRLLEGNNRYGLEVIAKTAPQQFLEVVWPWFIEVLAPSTGHRLMRSTYRESDATWMSYSVQALPLLQALHLAADGWATADPKQFSAFALQSARETDELAAHRILAQGLAAAAPQAPAAAVQYLTGDRRRLIVGTHNNQLHFSEALISAAFPLLTPEQRLDVEKAIIAFEAFPHEEYVEREAEQRRQYMLWNREYRLRLLRAIPDNSLTDQSRELKRQESERFPNLQAFDHPSVEMSFIGARMTAEEMSKASAEDILHLFDVLADSEDSSRNYRPDLPLARSGGVRQQAAAFTTAAAINTRLALEVLNALHPQREDHQAYAAAAITGLLKSSLPASKGFELLLDLDEQGFRSDDFRETVSNAFHDLVKTKVAVPESITALLERWLTEVIAPAWPQDRGDEANHTAGTPIIFGHGMMFTLLHGRAAIFRAIAASFGDHEPTDAQSLLRVVSSRLDVERHPRVLAEMLLYARSIFTVKDAMVAGSEAFNRAMTNCPDVLEYDSTWHVLSFLSGYIQPESYYENWLERLASRPDERDQQAFGELLFLYYARRKRLWADRLITNSISSGSRARIRGMAYGAADAFPYAHCRSRATDILCATVATDDSEMVKIANAALFPLDDDTFPLDSDARRLIQAILDHPLAIKELGTQLLETVSMFVGPEPAYVLSITKSVLDTIRDDVSQLGRAAVDVDAALTNIAVTLHRHPTYRTQGLDLFERLLNMGLHEVAAALDLLDNRPDRVRAPVYRRPRIRRHRRKDTE